jgi:hypothetical protein
LQLAELDLGKNPAESLLATIQTFRLRWTLQLYRSKKQSVPSRPQQQNGLAARDRLGVYLKVFSIAKHENIESGCGTHRSLSKLAYGFLTVRLFCPRRHVRSPLSKKST